MLRAKTITIFTFFNLLVKSKRLESQNPDIVIPAKARNPRSAGPQMQLRYAHHIILFSLADELAGLG